MVHGCITHPAHEGGEHFVAFAFDHFGAFGVRFHLVHRREVRRRERFCNSLQKLTSKRGTRGKRQWGGWGVGVQTDHKLLFKERSRSRCDLDTVLLVVGADDVVGGGGG